MNALVTIERAALPAVLTATLELAADFAKASKAPATQAAYASDFHIFEAWCAARGLCARYRPRLRRCAAFWPVRRPPASGPVRSGDA